MSYRKHSEERINFSVNQNYSKKTVITRNSSTGSFMPDEVITLVTEDTKGLTTPMEENPKSSTHCKVNEESLTTKVKSAPFLKRNFWLPLFGGVFILLSLTLIGISVGTLVSFSNHKHEKPTKRPKTNGIERFDRIFPKPDSLKIGQIWPLPDLSPKKEVVIQRLYHLAQISNITSSVIIFGTEMLEENEWNWDNAPLIEGNIFLTVALASNYTNSNLHKILSWLRYSIVKMKFDCKSFETTCTGFSVNLNNEIGFPKATELEIFNVNKCCYTEYLKQTLNFSQLTQCNVIKTDLALRYHPLLNTIFKSRSKNFQTFTLCDQCDISS